MISGSLSFRVGCGVSSSVLRNSSVGSVSYTHLDVYKRQALTGGDLIARGMTPGPHVGAALKRALEATIVGTVANDKAALLEFLGL